MADALLIALLAIIVLGPRKLPELARQLARILTELRRGKDDFFAQFREPEPEPESRFSDLRSQSDSATAHLVKDVTDNA
jgi:sec-independent protein translocase protein TatB